MVNVKNLFGMAVMATALVGCASNDEVNNPNAEQQTNGVSYASFKINLPTTSGTRADDPKPGTPSFDGGEASEYAVNNATVIVFKKAGKSENDYTFVTSTPIGNMVPWNKDNDNENGVTTAARVTALLQGLTQEDIKAKNYYALILLNNDIDTKHHKVSMPSEGDTYEKWNVTDCATNVSGDKYVSTDKGIFMANAPEYKAEGPLTLVQIEGIYNSKEAANASAGTVVYVERGLSKVTVDGGDQKKVGGTVYDGATVDIKDWTLDVLNKKTYAVHVTAGLNSADNYAGIWSNKPNNRFFDATTTRFQRVYWGIDPNYSNLKDKADLTDYNSDFSIMSNSATFTADPFVSPVDGKNAKFVNSGKSMYCLENTFDIENMTQGQTTRVVFKAKYTPKDYATETDGTDHNDDLLGDDVKGTFFMLGKNPQTWTPIALTKQIKTYTVEAYNAVNPTAKIDASKVSVDLKSITIDNNNGEVDFSKITIKVNSAALTSAVSDVVKDKLGTIIAYKGGTSYYIARIKHFNELTPWNAGEKTYDKNNDKYLGRYGVLRNNWYYLTVDKVSNPGSPTVPTITPNIPDDENNYYISVSVKILDWAKRSQTVDL